METPIMTRFQQMAKLVHHDVLHTPFRQQQQIERETNFACPHITLSPTGDGRFVANHRRTDTHLLRMPLHHRFYQGFQPRHSLDLLSLRRQRQLTIELRPFLMFLTGSLSGLVYPVTMLFNESLHHPSWQSYRRRHVHIAIFHDAHRQPARSPVCHLYCHTPFQVLNANLSVSFVPIDIATYDH